VPLMEAVPFTKPVGTVALRVPATESAVTVLDFMPLKVTWESETTDCGAVGSAVSPDPVMTATTPGRRIDGNTPVIVGWVRVAAFLPTALPRHWSGPVACPG
jgi:hypothetical protein